MAIPDLRRLLKRLAGVVIITGCAFASARSLGEEPVEIASIEVFPPEVSLHTSRDFQQLLVLGTTSNGINVDLTDQATFAIDQPVAEIRAATLYPSSDGSAMLYVTVDGNSITVPITVVGASNDRPISFKLDVMPVFMAAGCNTGACHGSARGQDGFRLSLFGFDPNGDYRRITREISGRRINLAQPDESLILQKALGRVTHTGGKRFDESSPYYDAILRWIHAGAPREGNDVAQVLGLELFPPQAVLRGEKTSCRMIVRAIYSDGTTRDVTNLVVFRTNNDRSVAIAKGGSITTGARGEAFITASFASQTEGSPFIVLPADGDTGRAVEEYPEANYIDKHVNAKLAKLRIRPSDLCSDEEFLRRIHLDLIGLLPTTDERDAFLSSSNEDKRAQLVDALLERREFVDQQVMQWAELLQIRSNNQISYKAALLYFEWLRGCFSDNVPLDELVRRVLTATGGTFTEPATNFYLNQPDALVLAENVAQAFMGTRIQCAQCHNHPFDRWTQQDYYGFVSFFTQVGRKRAEDQRETIIFNSRRGEYNHPVTGRPVPPTFLGDEAPEVGNRDRRAVIAAWLTSPENPWFARSIANRIWANLMGVGIVEPVDDFRITNPPSNAELLDALTDRLVGVRFDVKRVVRDICRSNAYQRSTRLNESNETDDRNFAHALVRRLRAETLLDVICQVTEQPEKFRGLPLGARGVEIADGTTTNYFLTTFGRAKRNSVSACEVVREPSLSQALHLLNGGTVHQKIVGGNVVGRLLESGAAQDAVLDALYLRCLQRRPTDQERTAILELARNDENPKSALEDAFWALLNSREFIFNH